MNLVSKFSLCAGEQLQISLMDKRSRLKCVIGPLSGKVPGSDSMQFVVQGRSQLVQRRVVAGAELFEQLWQGGAHSGESLPSQKLFRELSLPISLHTNRTRKRL